jgi:SAM-dependent methyltransferase
MFDLTEQELAAVSVLDCCAGGSSLAAETEGHVLAVDPAYALGHSEIATRVMASLAETDQIVEANQEYFDWSWYGDPAHRTSLRTVAAQRFLTDMRARPDRYIAGALPHLPLADNSFDLVVCSHLLFTWSDQYDEEWHRRALRELIRVARREVRIFPLVVQRTGEPVAFMDTIRTELHAAGYPTHLQPVAFRFQRDAEHMLVVSCNGPAPTDRAH